MSVALYFDVHVRGAVTEGLRLREVDVLTAQEDGAATMDDPVLLDRAMALGRVVFTQDEDFLAIHAQGDEHAGIIYCHQHKYSLGELVRLLLLVWEAYDPEELRNKVEYL